VPVVNFFQLLCNLHILDSLWLSELNCEIIFFVITIFYMDRYWVWNKQI